MRLLTFSVLRNCRLKSLLYQVPVPRQRQAVVGLSEHSAGAAERDPGTVPAAESESNLLEFLPSWPAHEHAALRAQLPRDMRVLPHFVSEDEERAIMLELEPVLKRMRYEYDHWDNAIHGFRETERRGWQSAEASEVMQRVLAAAFSAPDSGQPLPHQHVLDLAPAGHIKPHVDAVRFCGEVIAGICLLSDAVMRLSHEQHPHLQLHALLPRRCMYVMRGTARYQFTHAVEGNAENMWRGQKVVKRRRVAVITRSRPEPEPAAAGNPGPGGRGAPSGY